MYLNVDPELKSKFPGLKAQIFRVKDVEVRREEAGLEEHRQGVAAADLVLPLTTQSWPSLLVTLTPARSVGVAGPWRMGYRARDTLLW